MSRLLFCVGLVALLAATGGAQTRDPAAVLADMRTALGGDAALDAVQTPSASGSLIAPPPHGPHHLQEFANGQMTAETRLARSTINPKMDARRFNIGK